MLLSQALKGLGYAEAPSFREARVVVVNTCTVTRRADSEARRFFARVKRENPACLLVATGCYATRDSSSWRESQSCAERNTWLRA